MTWILVLTLLTTGLTLWRPKAGVAALILLWPSYLMRGTLIGIPTTALELSLYGAVGATIIHLWRHRASLRPTLPRPWVWLFIVWSGAWILATIFAVDRTAALGALKAWWFDASLFGLLVVLVTRSEEDVRLMMKSALVSGAVVSVAGFLQLVAFRSTLQDGRLSSFFHPVANYAAMYLGPLFVLGVGVLVWHHLRGWIWWLVVGSIGVALLLTVSFAGFAAAGGGAVMIWLASPRGRWKRWFGWGTLAVALAAALILPRTHFYAEHFNSTDRSSSLVRGQIWNASWHLILKHPITGIGPNTFEPQYRKEVATLYWSPLEWLVSQPHNLYLALWLETGLLGLLAFVWFAVWWLTRTWRLGSVLARATVIAVLTIFLHGLFDTPYFKNDLAMQFILLCLLPWLSPKKEN